MQDKPADLMRAYEEAHQKMESMDDLSRVFKEYLGCMEQQMKSRRSSVGWFSCCGKTNKYTVDQNFVQAFHSLSPEQKVVYYVNTINYAAQSREGLSPVGKVSSANLICNPNDRFPLLIHEGFRLRKSPAKIARIERYKLQIKDGLSIDLRNYLIRNSKKNDGTYTLLAINKTQPKQFKFSFETDEDHNQYLPFIRRVILEGQRQNVIRMASVKKLDNNPDQVQGTHDKILNPRDGYRKTFNEKLQTNPDEALWGIKNACDDHQGQEANQKGKNFQKKSELGQLTMKKHEDEKPKSQMPDLGLSPIQINKISHSVMERNKRENTHIKDQQQDNLDLKLAAVRPRKQSKASVQSEQYHKNVYKALFPNKSYQDITNMIRYRRLPSYGDKNLQMYVQNVNLDFVNKVPSLKMVIISSFPSQVLIKLILNVQKYQEWHQAVKSSHIVMHLKAQNCLVAKTTFTSIHCKERIYLKYLFHCFYANNCYYLLQSQADQHEPQTHKNDIVGKLEYGLWRISPENNGTTKIYYELKIVYPNLEIEKQINITKEFMLGFYRMNHYFNQKEKIEGVMPVLDMKWMVSQGQPTQRQLPDNHQLDKWSSVEFGDCQSISSCYYTVTDQDSFLLAEEQEKNNEEQKLIQDLQVFDNDFHNHVPPVQFSRGESFAPVRNQTLNKSLVKKDSSQIRTKKQVHSKTQVRSRRRSYSSQMFLNHKQLFAKFEVKLDREGFVVPSQEYLTNRFLLQPRGPAAYPKMETQFKNIVFENDWTVDKDGDMVLTNEKKLKAVNGVVTHIIKKMKENLFQGKGLINISLPVTIFKDDSNTERIARSWAMAPFFIEDASKIPNQIERMKSVVAFGITTSTLYFNVEKPFNPILGQTYQAFIAGCPIYAEQISHHPPICALQFFGRGYRMNATLEVKVEVRANSGAGANDGFINVYFQDGQKISFNTPKGQISGLMFGKRTFKFKGTCYYVDQANRVVSEINFQQATGYFSKSKRTKSFQFEGRILIVTEEFMNQFREAGYNKKIQKKHIERVYSTVSGEWPNEVKFDGNLFYSVNDQLPYQVLEEAYPLASHCNYREDILYRKRNNLERSQTEKERLEQLQRSDRKLRETRPKA